MLHSSGRPPCESPWPSGRRAMVGILRQNYRGVCVQIHGDPVQLFAICLLQCWLIPPVTPHARKRRKRNIQVNGNRNSARSPCVSFLETRNARGGTFIVFWKRNTRKTRVCFPCFHFPVFRLRPYEYERVGERWEARWDTKILRCEKTVAELH